MLVVRGHIHRNQLWATCQYRPDLRNVTGLYGVCESRNVSPIDKRFELRPTCKAVSASYHYLRIAECERGTVWVAFELIHLCDGSGHTGPVFP